MVWYFNQLHTLWYVEKLKPCGNLRKPAETRKGFLYCWNCTETYYIRFQLTETLRKLFSSFPHCWNLTETYTSGFRWRKLDGIQLKLYNSFRIAETIQETSTPSFHIVSAVFQFCWNGIFHPVVSFSLKFCPMNYKLKIIFTEWNFIREALHISTCFFG